jgi:hypothetical protein
MRYQSTTGLDAELIEELVGRVRRIAPTLPVGGRPSLLCLDDQVVLTLVLLRQNLTQSVVGELFGVSQPVVSRTYNLIRPLLTRVLGADAPTLTEATRGRVVLVDGTDVLTGNRAGHDDNYSGKRHRQGLNIQVASDITGRLLGVSHGLPGRTHDRAAFHRSGWQKALAGADVIADPAYLGTYAVTARKKPRGGELSARDRANNKTLASIRSAVERCIGHLKNWKIISTGYRGPLHKLQSIIRTVALLEFYRLRW